MRPRWLLKACPHCGGDLMLDESDPYGSYDCKDCARPYYRVLPPDYATYRLELEQDRRRRQPRTPTLPLPTIEK
jgi:hypothetical protein